VLIGEERVLGILESYRLLWIEGRFGGGKTSLAFRLARPFLERGYRLLTNIRSVWADNPNEIDFVDEWGHLKLVVIMDEGGLWLKRNKMVEAMAAYAAKMDCVYIIPSFFAPASYFRIFRIAVLYGFRHIKIPIIFYRWRLVSSGFVDRGILAWIRPEEIYGVYSRQDPAMDGRFLVKFMAEKVQEYRKKYDRDYPFELPDLEEDDETGELQTAIADFSDAVTELRSFSRRRR